MKKWETPAIAELNINETEHTWSDFPKLDGGYIGDGIISGWFGDKES